MRRTLLIVVCLPLLVLFAPTLRAGEKAVDTPTVVVRAKSLDSLLQNLNLVVKLIGQEDAAQQIEGLIKSKIGKKGIEGIDPTRPFGAYVRFGKAIDDIKGAILIPMADEKTFLALLDNLGVKYTKDKDGIYTHKTDKNVDLYFRFAHEYLYITSVNTESIQTKNLPNPAKALAIRGDATFAVVARIDQIPDSAKQIALGQLAEAIGTAKKKAAPNETKVQEEFRTALLDDVHQLAKSVINEAEEIRFDLDVSEKAKEMTVNFNVIGKPGSALAKTIKGLGDLKSPLAGLVTYKVAFQGAFHLALPDGLKKALGNVIDEVTEDALKSIQDEKKRDQAKALFDAMAPTAKSGEFQLVASIVGPQAERYAIVAALKLKDGDKLGKTAYALLQEARDAMPKKDQDKVQLDTDNVGAVKIHRFEVPKDGKIDKFLADVAGDNQLYLAFRDDALFFAIGKDSLPALKAALAKKDSVASSPLVFDFDVARMAPLMAQTPEQKKLAAKHFPPGENGRVRLAVEGGTSLNARLQMQLNVLEFMVKLKNDQGK